MAEIPTIFAGAQVWEWMLFAYLIYRGLAAIKGGAIGIGKLFTIPGIFAVWVLAQLWRNDQAGTPTFTIWAIMMLLGAWITILLNNDQDLLFERDSETVALPGSPTTLILVLVAFVSKYWIGFTLTIREGATPLSNDNAYILLDAAISGAITGVFTGRFIRYWRRYYKKDNGAAP